ncbi:serine/threonine-protein kinase/endoribonuclease IRE1-like [Anopheles cruzii]|uniref:serine/threonine-protein kinase/endoribonuclease IRE1-like n=1 Tax=Anopheles cruzii TaxID=68878 RepID=UPI0022EC458C|nr:serine/threonine-protein kinase/endoribonuclease IRE1-like [Anopheles cruzii]
MKTGTATGPGGGSYSETIDLGDGEMRVGNIRFNEQNVLGKGCRETSVFVGSFGDRKAAVKRMRADCFRMADCEVAALCKSDEHENVVRYYCTEQDRQFQYIAIELCAGTLEDYVDDNTPPAIVGARTMPVSLREKIFPLDILRQATKGIIHLHGLGIVHRDIKPQNILLSLPDDRGCVRVKISGFSLCKKLNYGKESLSQNSGVTGTNSWIAPKMQFGQRVTIYLLQTFGMQSLKSKNYVKEQFAWRHYYWYLTNEGIEYLRAYLHLPSEIVPSTLKRAARSEPQRARPQSGPRPDGPKSGEDRQAYRRTQQTGPADKKGDVGAGTGDLEFRGGFGRGNRM